MESQRMENGMYVIFDHRGEGLNNPPIGRYPVEDISLSPKPVFSLPSNQGFEFPKWVVEKMDKGYHLKAFGSPVGIHKNQLCAFLLHERDIEEWIVTFRPEHGKDIATIEKADKSVAWCVEENKNPNQPKCITMKPLPSRGSSSHLPENVLFTFVRMDKSQS
ncbi:hypothetical protein TWF730_007363 [Orbilia blumenaviensis]|uniref:Uncharacterized protein n=1 Tax=Orbilia blumenaviensis TaxID=1796055 RepID=A0AAV9V9W1_9PEZI